MKSRYISELDDLKVLMKNRQKKVYIFWFIITVITILLFAYMDNIIDITKLSSVGTTIVCLVLFLISLCSLMLANSIKREVLNVIDSAQNLYLKNVKDYTILDYEQSRIENIKYENDNTIPCASLINNSVVYFEKDFVVTLFKKQPKKAAVIYNMVTKEFFDFVFIETVIRADMIKTIKSVIDKDNDEFLFIYVMDPNGEALDVYFAQSDSKEEAELVYKNILDILSKSYPGRFEYIEEFE